MIPNETHGIRLFQAATEQRSSYPWMNVADAKRTRTRTRSDPAPSAATATSRNGWLGLVYGGD